MLGLCVALPSLYSPLGRDQGVFLYVGREWLQGRLPYRDTFDMKPPAIHAVYALSLALFGDRIWGIRVFDMLAAVSIAMSAAFIAKSHPRPGARGAAILTTSLFYYGFFDFWNTAQCEIWCAAFSLASLCAARRMRSNLLACLAGGALLAIGGMFKPPGIFSLPVVLAFIWFREPRALTRTRLTRCGLTILSCAAAFCLVAAYFALHGALIPMISELGNNVYYLRKGNEVHSWAELFDKVRIPSRVFGAYVGFLTALGLIAAFAACRRRAWGDAAASIVPVTLTLVAIFGVAIQQRFYWYHWGLLVGPMALAFSQSTEEMAKYWPRIAAKSGLTPMIAGSFCVVMFSLSGSSSLTEATSLWGTCKGALLRASGRLSPEQYDARFDFSGSFSYSIPTSIRIADWLRAHSSPDDAIAVRGHEPQIYALAGRRHTGRFFWTSFLTVTEWSPDAKRAAWLAEDRDVFLYAPPRFVVTPSWDKDGPNAESSFEALGYERRTVVDGWAILEYRQEALISSRAKR